MKSRVLMFTAFLLFLNVSPKALAQTCSPWLGVQVFNGNYTLSAQGTTALPNGGSYSLNHTMQAKFTIRQIPVSCSATQVIWTGTDTSSQGTVNDSAVENNCNPGSQNFTVVGSGSNLSTFDQLTLDLSAGTFTFQEIDFTVASTISGVDCNGQSYSGPQNWTLSPLNGWPSFTLPGVVQALSENTSFQAQAFIVPTGSPFAWTFTLTLNPATQNDNQDDPCSQAGGSTIGCQNQSLGEDVPIVGTGFHLHYEGDRSPGRALANSAATADARMLGGWTLNVHHAYDPTNNALFLGDGSQRSGWQLGTPAMYNGSYLLTSKDGSEVYLFDGTSAHHLQTLKSMTGVVKYKFAYDAAGNLSSVTDASGNVTTIQRDGSEHPTAIVSPYSQTTTLAVDGNGFLNLISDPAGHTQTFSNTTGGLLNTRTDANGNLYTYQYDSLGRLILDSDSVGGSTSLSRTDSNSGYTVVSTTALGRTSSYQVTLSQTPGEQLTNIWPNGLTATETDTQQSGQLQEATTLPDGTSNTRNLGPDPRFGLEVPVLTSGTLTKGGLSETVAGSRTASFTTGNPFSLVSQTDANVLNGRTYTQTFTTSSRTYLNTSPVGRKTTLVRDSLERPASLQVGTLTKTTYSYDSHGRLATTAQGTRKTSMTYDANGFLATITDPLKLKTSFTHDADGRLLTITLPDGRVISDSYDANGNLTAVTPPGKSAHDFAYTAVDLPSTYTPPTVPGTGATTYAYNPDRQVTTITRPDAAVINNIYDSAGRLSSVVTPTETVDYTYDATTGNLAGAAISGGEAIAYAYNGPLPTSSTWSGTVAGSVARTFDNNFWVNSQSLNGDNTVNFTRDNDGLTTKAGSLVIRRNATNELITGTSLGSVTDALTYDAFGELTGYTAKYKTTVLYTVKYTRDAEGRVSAKAETIGGTTTTYNYIYDQAGRLTGVKQNGTTSSTYTYDTNSNRLSAVTTVGTFNGTYDAQDRLLTYGNASLTYTANGELASQAVGSQTTTFSYDVLGNLVATTLPNATAINYLIDPENNRIGKQVNGSLQSGFLYDGPRVVAQLNGSNQIVSQFVYATGSNVPDFMLKGGVTYRIFADQLGSPRLVVNSTTGAVAERIDYDEFGNIINDTSPGFQPFGFAGGLYDQDTKLVRFGARDYNPSTGRWTAKDPILFAGGDTNLYGYVLDEPINLRDPSGKGWPQWLVSFLTSFGIDVGAAKVQGQAVDPTAVLDAAPLPAGSFTPAAQFAANPENARNICEGLKSIISTKENQGLSPTEVRAMQGIEMDGPR